MGLLVIICLILLAIVAVQIGRVTELAAKIRGEEEMQEQSNKRHGFIGMVFMIVFLVGCVWSSLYYKNWMLGYGPHESASAHGGSLDDLFDITLFFTGIVFVITQILLFYFANKYRGVRGRKALFMPHDNTLEIVWTAIPALVMAFLVIKGLDVWNTVMADVGPEDNELEIEATGYQFAWNIRYPGADNKLGTRDFKKIVLGSNPIGQDWTDKKNLDDFHPSEIVLPVGKKVRVRITALDVLHNFYLPHFRVKMDAIPGLPTYFVFTPTKTTEEYRRELSKYPEYNALFDQNDPELGTLWENFEYELACAELCGTGHFSMRRVVRVVSEEEYQDWLDQQQSLYLSQIRGTDEDPYKDEWLDFEIAERRSDFNDTFEKILTAPDSIAKIIRFKYVNFETGSAQLTALSRYELGFLVDAMNKYPNLTIELSGHTDNTGDIDANQLLSENRAKSVYDFLLAQNIGADRLTSVGYGQTQPIDTNDTDAGREQNRRTEFKILTQ